MRNRFKQLSIAVLIMGVFTSPAFALKSVTGYVCQTTYTAQNNVWFGSDGYVTVRMYSGADCSGTYQGNFYYHSSGASNQGYVFSEAERRTLFAVMQKASFNDRRVNLFTSDQNGIFHSTVYSN